jgi:predicted transcriptional regulator
MTTDSEYEILDILYQDQVNGVVHEISQRELAKKSDLSLGMTNMILKRLLKRGWLTAQQVNIRKVRYLMTNEGINELSRRSFVYFKKTIKNVVKFKDAMDAMVSESKRGGHTCVLLVGKSDLDFIIEHACERHGLQFFTSIEKRSLDGALVVFSEDTAPPPSGTGDGNNDGSRYLSQVISGTELE